MACLDEGRCSVVQYVSRPSQDAERRLASLEDKYGEAFECRRLADPQEIGDPEARKLLEILEHFHPTLAWNPATGAKMMWVEGYHPLGSTYASNCDYYAPDFLEQDARDFELYHNKLELAWEVTKKHQA